MTLSILADEGNWMMSAKLYPFLLKVVLLGAYAQMLNRIHAAQGLALCPPEYSALACMFNACKS